MIGDVAIGMTAFGVYGYMSTWLKQREDHSLGPAKTAAISGNYWGICWLYYSAKLRSLWTISNRSVQGPIILIEAYEEILKIFW